jgi:peroxiredoxin
VESVRFRVVRSKKADPFVNAATKINTDSWKDKTVVLFAIPGAFTVGQVSEANNDYLI